MYGVLHVPDTLIIFWLISATLIICQKAYSCVLLPYQADHQRCQVGFALGQFDHAVAGGLVTRSSVAQIQHGCLLWPDGWRCVGSQQYLYLVLRTLGKQSVVMAASA